MIVIPSTARDLQFDKSKFLAFFALLAVEN